MRRLAILAGLAGLTMIATPAPAQLSSFMREGVPGSAYASRLSDAQRGAAVRKALKLDFAPTLTAFVSLTPDAPYAPDGSHLSFWKPSYVIGTAEGGEAAVNFWGIHNDGHVNIGLAPTSATIRLLDCRLLVSAGLSYKIYSGADGKLTSQGVLPLSDGHALLLLPAATVGQPVSIEIWPSPGATPMGFLGCDVGAFSAGSKEGRP